MGFAYLVLIEWRCSSGLAVHYARDETCLCVVMGTLVVVVLVVVVPWEVSCGVFPGWRSAPAYLPLIGLLGDTPHLATRNTHRPVPPRKIPNPFPSPSSLEPRVSSCRLGPPLLQL
ncbi:hypothetical protein E2C01_049530 [Portunus trituberculatus]|uniref:Uncharacterized protein n=1 Tax=Portunus trituberculatus TaxID=210409 RepID=A0A5B7GE47_PORTR|nr:hypothetical protein [Portunus trituberculatus]